MRAVALTVVLRLVEAFFVAVAGVSAAFTVHQTRVSRVAEQVDRWRREQEERLRQLAAALVAVGEAAIRWRAEHGQEANFEVAQLRLRQAFTDALNPWLEIDVIADASGEAPAKVTPELIEEALGDVNRAIQGVRDEARTQQERVWRLRRALPQ
jgi:hypothetical protein